MEGVQKRPGNYLVFDGGHSALSALYMIEEICARLQFDLESNNEVLVRDYCDLLGGTSTGAVAAILLGRMNRTPSQAIDAYLKLEPTLSVQPTKDEDERRQNTEAFKAAFTGILVEAGFAADTPMMDETAPKTVVWTLNASNLSVLQPIRSYRVRSAPGPPFTILDAACASIASPDTFFATTVGIGHRQVVLVDAMAGYANPIKELLQEAQRVSGEDAEVASIVSLGAGKGEVLNVTGTANEDALADAVKKMALDSEQTHKEMHRHLHRSLVYFRLNVEHGLIGHMSASAVHAHTSAYMQEGDTDKLLNDIIESFKSPQKGSTLKDINSVATVEITLRPRPSVVENFVGREDILDALRAAHFSSRPPELHKPVVSVLMGLGGSGKTQIALKFALEYEKRYRDASIYFFNASSEAKIKAEFELAIHTRDSTSRSKSYDDGLIWFANRKDPWLIVMDNADDPSVELFHFIPKSSHGNIIITSRNATYNKFAPTTSHRIEGLSPIDASTLILKGSSYLDNQANRTYALLISEELGYIPLALAHAAAYISDHQCLPAYLNIYRQRRAKFLATRLALPEDYILSVATTIQMSFDSISPAARNVMVLLSRLDATLIAHCIIAKAAERQFRHIDARSDEEILDPQTIGQANALMAIFCPSGKWLESDFNDIIRQCLQYSLLQITAQGKDTFYSMHVLVQAYMQSISANIQQNQTESLVVRLLGSAISVDHHHKYQALNRVIAPHLRLVAVDHVLEVGDHFGFGQVLREQGNALLSTEHFERCLALRRSGLGDESIVTMGAMHELAISYGMAGRHQDALDLKVKVLDLRKRILGDEHPDTLNAMGNLAVSYHDLGSHQQALDLGIEVLDQRKRILGDEHPDTLSAMSNLATSYSSLGRHQKALELEEKVLDLRKRISGDEHPETVRAMENLALSYSDLGMDQKALKLNEKVLELWKRVSGDEHPDTARAMGNIASSYGDLGMDQEALELKEKALDLWKRVSGDEHPETMRAMDNLALSYSALGEHQKALELEEQVLMMLTQLLGDEHPDTLVSMCNLGVISHRLGMKERAIALLQAALPLQEKVQGMSHPCTVVTRDWLQEFLDTSQQGHS